MTVAPKRHTKRKMSARNIDPPAIVKASVGRVADLRGISDISDQISRSGRRKREDGDKTRGLRSFASPACGGRLTMTTAITIAFHNPALVGIPSLAELRSRD